MSEIDNIKDILASVVGKDSATDVYFVVRCGMNVT